MAECGSDNLESSGHDEWFEWSGSRNWSYKGTTVHLVQASESGTDAKYVTDMFETDKPAADVKSKRVGNIYVIQFPVSLTRFGKLDKQRQKSHNCELLSQVNTGPVQIKLDYLKTIPVKSFLKSFFESIMSERNDEADYKGTSECVINLCVSEPMMREAVSVFEKLPGHEIVSPKEMELTVSKNESKLARGALEETKVFKLRMEQLCKYGSTSDTCTAVGSKDEQAFEDQQNIREFPKPNSALREPESQTMFRRDRNSWNDGQSNMQDSQGQQTAAACIGQARWQWSYLEQDPAVETYIIVNGIPAGYDHMTLCAEIFQPPFPIRRPHVIYPERNTHALLICCSTEDAEKLNGYRYNCFRFDRLKEELLKKVTISLNDENLFKKIVSQKDKLKKALKPLDITFQTKDTDREIIILSPTHIQIQFAVNMICSICKIYERYKTDSYDDFKSIDTFSISDLQLDVLVAVEQEAFKQLQAVNQIVIDEGKVTYTISPDTSKYWNRFKEAGEDLRKKQMKEIHLKNTETIVAESFTKEICGALGSICCIYLERKGSIVAFSNNYEDLLKVKHQLMIKQGKIQLSGRENRKLVVNAESIKDPNLKKKRRDEKKNAGKREFNWDLHAHYLHEFKTRECIVVKVYKANILDLPVDCIVNVVNYKLNHGGGVAKVIADAAEDDLVQDGYDQVRIKGSIPVGFAYTTTAGRLKYHCVINAVGPAWYDYHPYRLEDVLRCEDDVCYAVTNSFYEAEKQNLSTIALPAISAAMFGVPEEICAYQYALATVKYSKLSVDVSTAVKEIHFFCINKNMIAKIQDMFHRVLDDDSRPYSIQKYVKGGSSTGQFGNQNEIVSLSQHKRYPIQLTSSLTERQNTLFHPELGGDNPKENEFEMIKYNRHGGFTFVFSFGNQLTLYIGDLFKYKADAMVSVEDPNGKGAGVISKYKSNTCYNKYKEEKRYKFWYERKVGDVLPTCAFNKGFQKVLHAVYPYNEISKSIEQRKQSLQATYANIFKTASLEGLSSLSMILIGTGQDQTADMKLSAHAFIRSYIVFCNRMTNMKQTQGLLIQLVCREEKRFSVVQHILDEAFENCKRQTIPPPRLHSPEEISTSAAAYTSDVKVKSGEVCAALNSLHAGGKAVITYASSLDPDERPHNAMSHQDPNCLSS